MASRARGDRLEIELGVEEISVRVDVFACAIPGYSSAKTRSTDVHLDHPTLPFDRDDPLLERVEQLLG